MSFAEKVHNRLLALEKQVVALSERLKALEEPPVMTVSRWEVPVVSLPTELTVAPIKRGPGRPKKVANG